MVIYLDNAASTQMAPEAITAINEACRHYFGNPSSLHGFGRKARKIISKSRKAVAKLINADPEEIVFTSGATESNNTVFDIAAYDLIISSPSEHPCVLEPAKASGKPIVWLKLDREGFIDLKELETHLKRLKSNIWPIFCPSKKILVSIMHGNNEIATVQNIEAIGALCKKYKAIFHTDCVQTFLKFNIDVRKFHIDFLSLSAHKIHGPKGLGVLYINRQLRLRKEALLKGGGQEDEHRSGTENVPAIFAFSKLLESDNIESNAHNLRELEEFFLNALSSKLKAGSIVLNGARDPRNKIPGIINMAFPQSKLNSEQLVLQLDLAGLCVSSGSACSANKTTRTGARIWLACGCRKKKAKENETVQMLSSYVLRACRVPEDIAAKSIRISLSKYSSREELIQAADSIAKIIC
jgi:cysteine desulfurase